jgi:VanZ family protein
LKNRNSTTLRRLASLALAPQTCRWTAFAFFAAMLLAGAIPGKAEALSAVIYDKLLHFIAYSILSALVYGALEGGLWRRALLAVAAIGLLGAFDEAVQALLSYRHGNLFDWQVDLLAACLTVGALSMLQATRRLPEPVGKQGKTKQ